MKDEVFVLGAGMVGVCCALHLLERGHRVALVDRSSPGRETSFGNAGIIQREAVEPYAFPHDWRALLNVAFRRGSDVNYHFGALPTLLPRLAAYWWASSPSRYASIARDYARLIAHSLSEHEPLIEQAAAWDLVRRNGYRSVFHTSAALDEAARGAERLHREHGIRYALLDGAALAQAESGLRAALPGALHWLDPWTVSDPGELVSRYAKLFVRRGGQVLHAEVKGLRQQGSGWSVDSSLGMLPARHVVLALGPWAGEVLKTLGYRLPLFVKRGYHRHYRGGPGLSMPLLDSQSGFVLAPTAQGIRLTTGAEFAMRQAPATPVQLAKVERAARQLIELPLPVEPQPWMGSRPCTVDMKPVIGAAPRHDGLWFNFGHAHQGFTLGPASGRLLADLIEGATPFIDPRPYSPARF